MKTHFSIALLFFLSIAGLAGPSRSHAEQQSAGQSSASEKQNPQPVDKQNEASKTGSTPGAQKDKDEVVRISVTLVQVDAVVTDGKGKYVTDLQPEDFEITEDGKRQ